jgi:hypothetical protein
VVNAERVKRKLPSLLVDGCSNRNKKKWRIYMRYSYRLTQFKKNNPDKFNTLTNRLVADLTEIENAVNS